MLISIVFAHNEIVCFCNRIAHTCSGLYISHVQTTIQSCKYMHMSVTKLTLYYDYYYFFLYSHERLSNTSRCNPLFVNYAIQ